MFLNSGLHIDQAPPLHVPFRFFSAAPLFILLAGLSLLGWGGELLVTPLLSETVAVVHLVLLGWITMTMLGALYQMIPVLAAQPVPWLRLAPWVHGFLVVGVATFFLEIGLHWHRLLLLVASAGIGGALGLFILQTAVALYRAVAQHPTVTAMRLALFFLTATLTLGAIFLGEYAHGFLNLDRQAMVGTHLTFGLFGWVGLLIVGVSFQVLPMFYMTPPFPDKEAGIILALLVGAILLMPVALFVFPEAPAWRWLPALPGGVGVGLYALTLGRLLAARKRKLVDVTLPFWKMGLFSGLAALLVLLLWPASEAESLRYLFGVFYLFGWAGSIISGMLYKIIPFLVWFHRFSRLAGLAVIPMMDDLVSERVARLHFFLHGGTLLLLVLAVTGGWGELLRWAGLGLVGIAACLGYGLWFALRQKPPEVPVMPDFASFFKDMKIEGEG